MAYYQPNAFSTINNTCFNTFNNSIHVATHELQRVWTHLSKKIICDISQMFSLIPSLFELVFTYLPLSLWYFGS